MKERIKRIMDNENLTPAKFADQLQINRAVISHILNGRNNPSLDVVTKILSEMDYINPEWLLQGIGSIYKDGHAPSSKTQKEQSLFDTDISIVPDSEDELEYREENHVKSTKYIDKPPETQHLPHMKTTERKIRQIIIYYSDNTFETFTPH